MPTVSSLFTRAAARWHLLVLFVLAFSLSLWWSETGTERPREPVFTPPPTSLAQARAPLVEDVARPSEAGQRSTGIAAAAPAAPAPTQADPPHQHADGDNAPGIGLEPEPEPAPE